MISSCGHWGGTLVLVTWMMRTHIYAPYYSHLASCGENSCWVVISLETLGMLKYVRIVVLIREIIDLTRDVFIPGGGGKKY